MKRYFLSVLILLVLVLGVAYLATNVKVAGLSGLQVAQVSPACQTQAGNFGSQLGGSIVIAIGGQAVELKATSGFDVDGGGSFPYDVSYDELEFRGFELTGPPPPNPDTTNADFTESVLSPSGEWTTPQIQVSGLTKGTLYSWHVRGRAETVWSGYSDPALYFFVCL